MLTSQTGMRHFGQTLPFAGFIQSRQQGKASWLGPIAKGSSLKMERMPTLVTTNGLKVPFLKKILR